MAETETDHTAKEEANSNNVCGTSSVPLISNAQEASVFLDQLGVTMDFSAGSDSESDHNHNGSDDGSTDGENDNLAGHDKVFEEIKNKLDENNRKHSTHSLGSGSTASVEDEAAKTSEYYTNIPYGIQPRDAYEHGKKSADIMGVTYNGRMRQFVLLDSKGIVTWKRDAVDNRVTRCLTYPKYEYRLITYLLYARKYNCYFALGKDFSLKVLNRDFFETFSVGANLRSVVFLLFNPIRDELITGGVDGTSVYRFHQVVGRSITELKPMANFELTLKHKLPDVGGSWVKKVELDYNLGHLYCCSDTDLHVYNLEGKELFYFNRAHNMSITGCRFSISAKVLVTSSIDTEVKVWSMTGGLVHKFRGHSRAVTNLLIHPHNSTIVITCSLDGTIRMWSLDTMDAIYSLLISSSGLLWMGLTDDNLMYISTARNLTLWHLNHFVHFWSTTRNQVTRLQLEGCPGKTLRVLAVGEDSSIRLFARSNQKNLSTVLPPPNVSPLQKILGVCYSREFNVIFVLINPRLIWVYTTRTDPACRIAVWDVFQIQSLGKRNDSASQERPSLSSAKVLPTHRATESGLGNEPPSPCHSVCILKSAAMVWTHEGFCCPLRNSFLLLGLEDGRVLFMDPVVKGQKFIDFKVSKDPVVGLHHDMNHQCLVTTIQGKHLACIQFWTLPDLELVHDVFCATDVTAFSRIGHTCVTSHENGSVLFHTMETANDLGILKGKIWPEVEDVIDWKHRPEHMAPVITVDACVPMAIFCSCSKDGAIKVWEEDGTLLTEIMLDDTLSAACFLNKNADLIVAFQQHIFFISHTKICPHRKPTEPEDLTFDKESYIYEDPAVVYEGFVADPDPIGLENYLVPYEIEFSKDFLEGKITLEPVPVEPEESDEEGNLSLAPTEIYWSPPSTPGSLSRVDLMLGTEVSKYDLLQQMKTTLQTLMENQKIKYRGPSKRRKRQAPTLTKGPSLKEDWEEGEGGKLGGGEGDSKVGEERSYQQVVEMPRFGISPGPTPTITPSSSPEPVSEEDEAAGLEEEKSDTEDQIKALLPKKKIPDLELVAAKERPSKMQEQEDRDVKPDLSAPRRTRKGIADVQIDAEALMKGRRSVPVSNKEGDHSHVGQPAEASSWPEKRQRSATKKKTVAQRKLPKRGVRPDADKGQRYSSDVAAGADKSTMSAVSKLEEETILAGDLTTGQQESHDRKQSKRTPIDPDAIPTSDTISVDIMTSSTASSAKYGKRKSRQSSLGADSDEFSVSEQQDQQPDFPSEIKAKPLSASSSGFSRVTASGRDSVLSAAYSDVPQLPPIPPLPGSSDVENLSRPSTSGSLFAHRGTQDRRRPMEFYRTGGMTPSSDQEVSNWPANTSGSMSVANVLRPRSGILSDVDDVSTRPRSSTSLVSNKEAEGLVLESDAETGIVKGGPISKRPPSASFHQDSPSMSGHVWSHGSNKMYEVNAMEGGVSPPMFMTPVPPPGSPYPSRTLSAGSSHPQVVGPSSSLSADRFAQDVTSASPFPQGDLYSERMGSPESGLLDRELAAISMRETTGGEDEDEHRAWSRIGLPEATLSGSRRPATTLLPARQGQYADDGGWCRPFTAGHIFQTELGLLLELPSKAEELKLVFEAAYKRYEKMHVKAIEDGEKLYINKGVKFEDNWQERILERHMLLRMQRVLRAYSAQQKHQVLLQQRAKSASALQARTETFAIMKGPDRTARPHTDGPSFRRGLLSAPAPTPMVSRPPTAMGGAMPQVAPSSPSLGPLRSRTGDASSRIVRDNPTELEKKKQGQEHPFRLRLRETGERSQSQRQYRVKIDPWALDPRNQTAYRPQSKSIPSKCSRYVLLSRPRTAIETPIPTPLEEELLATRFPDQSVRLLQSAGTAIRPTPPQTSYGITYSPFALYG